MGNMPIAAKLGTKTPGRVSDPWFWVAQRFSAAIRSHQKPALAAEVRMVAPHRGNTGAGTYFITAVTFRKNSLFQSNRMADLFVQILQSYRSERKYLLHEFVLMPDHFHLLITPTLTLERALQLIKGGFSFRARKEFGFTGEIWEKSYHDRRVRDWEEYCAFLQYIYLNPVKEGLAESPEKYRFSSAGGRVELDAAPQRLKPSGSAA